MPNRLANSTSPYLLQHQDNPVDWHPWCHEALELAKKLDRPIFLSIGYSACHWCHVMAHESFEDPAIAQLINDSFIAIKVDREQRPDLDHIYMQAVQMLTGSGGWPMSVFLTPEGNPFFGGTYWPPYAKWGRPGFDQVLKAVADAWNEKREQIEKQGIELANYIQASYTTPAIEKSQLQLTMDDLWRAANRLEENFDRRFGGFGDSPKFPHTMDLSLLLRLQTREPTSERALVIRHTLDCMARGGMYDHVGGGFSRYSVDEYWLVPHFEKMLYDNALLIATYLDGYRLWKNESYLQIAVESAEYLLRDLRHSQGGFYSAEDADSEGVEGKFYVWSQEEIRNVLAFEDLGPSISGEDLDLFLQAYGVSEEGNFEGHNILNLIGPPEAQLSRLESLAESIGSSARDLYHRFTPARQKLLRARSQRIRPGLDDKILVAWNALAIDSLAQAGMVARREDLLDAAKQAMQFILDHLRPQGRLLHVWRQGVAEIPAFLDDYAYLIQAVLTLHQATQSIEWIELAESLAQEMISLFHDAESGGFMYVARDSESLIAKTRDDVDHSIPSGSGMAATVLGRLGILTGRREWTERAWQTIQASGALLQRSPGAAGQLWIALDWLLGPTREAVLILPPSSESFQEISDQCRTAFWENYAPRDVLLIHQAIERSSNERLPELLEGKVVMEGEPTLYLCLEGACQSPVTGKEEILRVLGGTNR